MSRSGFCWFLLSEIQSHVVEFVSVESESCDVLSRHHRSSRYSLDPVALKATYVFRLNFASVCSMFNFLLYALFRTTPLICCDITGCFSKKGSSTDADLSLFAG
jgi:hypothetical protein